MRHAVQIRLFGDPRETGSEVPALSISVNVCLESPTVLRREASRDVVPDFVDGFAFGAALGIGLRCMSASSWTVTALPPSPESCEAVSRRALVVSGHTSLILEQGITFSLFAHIRFVLGQTRVLPVRIAQSQAFTGDTLSFDVHATSGDSSLIFPVQLHISQLESRADTIAIKASYFASDISPMAFIALPPKDLNALHQTLNPPILALRVLCILF